MDRKHHWPRIQQSEENYDVGNAKNVSVHSYTLNSFIIILPFALITVFNLGSAIVLILVATIAEIQ